jgi:plastocyanin
MLIRTRYLLAIGMLLGALTACSSSSSTGSTPPSTSSGSTSSSTGGGTTVTITDFKFTPATLSVAVGTKVTFVNQGATVHTATTQDSSTISSGNLTKGQSYTVTFTKKGTYNYICTIHPFMQGTIVVH